MRKRLFVLASGILASLMFASSAHAFDCIRVSSSWKGLQQSTKSGNWLLIDFSSPSRVATTVAQFGDELTAAQAQCLYTEYSESGQPQFFALGVGVAGPNGVLAKNNPNGDVLSDGRGIDRLEESGIFPALIGAFGACGIPFE